MAVSRYAARGHGAGLGKPWFRVWKPIWAGTGLTRASGEGFTPGPYWSPGEGEAGEGSPQVQEGPDVVVPGERPEHLQHFGHVLLSTRRRARDRLYPARQPSPRSPSTPASSLPETEGPQQQGGLWPICPGGCLRPQKACPPLWGGPAPGTPPSAGMGAHHLSMVDPFLLFPRGYSSRQTNTPAPLNGP